MNKLTLLSPLQKLCGPNVLPRKGFSGRLATDELTLLGMLSELSKAPGRDDRQVGHFGGGPEVLLCNTPLYIGVSCVAPSTICAPR